MPKVDLAKLARQLTTAQIRQLGQIVDSAPELVRLKARREEILASIERVEDEIAKVIDSASKPPKPRETAKQGDSYDKTNRLGAVDTWVAFFLGGGERSSSEVLAAGEKVGFDVHDLHNARVRISAEIRQRGIAYWRLAETTAPKNPASIQVPATATKSDAPADESVTTTHPPVPDNTETVMETGTTDGGELDAAPCVLADDSAAEALPTDPEGSESTGDDSKDAAPGTPVDDSTMVEQPPVAEGASTI